MLCLIFTRKCKNSASQESRTTNQSDHPSIACATTVRPSTLFPAYLSSPSCDWSALRSLHRLKLKMVPILFPDMSSRYETHIWSKRSKPPHPVICTSSPGPTATIANRLIPKWTVLVKDLLQDGSMRSIDPSRRRSFTRAPMIQQDPLRCSSSLLMMTYPTRRLFAFHTRVGRNFCFLIFCFRGGTRSSTLRRSTLRTSGSVQDGESLNVRFSVVTVLRLYGIDTTVSISAAELVTMAN